MALKSDENFTTRQLHIRYVYKDPEFLAEMQEILKKHKESFVRLPIY